MYYKLISTHIISVDWVRMEQLAKYRWYLFYAKSVSVVFRNKVCENMCRIDIVRKVCRTFSIRIFLEISRCVVVTG